MAETYRYKLDWSKPKGTIHSTDDRCYTQQLPGFKKGTYDAKGILINNDAWNPGCGEIISKNRKDEREQEMADEKAKFINSMHPDMVELVTELKNTVKERLDNQDDVISKLSAAVAEQRDELLKLQAGTPVEVTESPNPESETESQIEAVDETDQDSEASESLAAEVGASDTDNSDADDEESEFDYKEWAFDTESTHYQTVRKMLRDKFGQDKKSKYDIVEYLVELGFLTRDEALETEPFKAKQDSKKN